MDKKISKSKQINFKKKVIIKQDNQMNKKIKIKVKSKLICMSQKKKSLKTNKVIKMSNRNLKMILMKKN